MPAEVAKHAGTLDFILDTVPAAHDLKPVPLGVFSLLFRRRRLAGSFIGGVRETQEMLDFCAEHGITADVERVKIQEIDEAFDRLVRGDVKYRFVVDMASLK